MQLIRFSKFIDWLVGSKSLYIKNINLARFLKNLNQNIEITEHIIAVKDLDSAFNCLTIAQISDLHIHQWNIELIENAFKVLDLLKPDVVAITGDLICNGKKFIPDLVKLMSNIDCKYGKFACLGNHDHSDGDNSLRIQNAFKKADIEILVNESAKITINGESIYFAGADDLELGEQNIIQMVRKIPEEAKKIFLTHNPYNFQEISRHNPDLVLSGHTHGGQLYFSVIDAFYKIILGSSYISGIYNHDNSSLYVNRGIGTALVSPVIFNKKFIINTPRINSKPEISLFTLIPTKN